MRRDVQKGICTFWTSFNLLFSICFFDNVKQVYHDLWAQSLLLAFACFLKSFSGIILLFQFWLGVRNVLQIKCQPNHCLDFIAVQRLDFYVCKIIAHKSSFIVFQIITAENVHVSQFDSYWHHFLQKFFCNASLNGSKQIEMRQNKLTQMLAGDLPGCFFGS